MNNIYVIITGPEHNGTTFLSKLICSIPDIYCGFETGLLLDNNFSICKPFCEWIYHGNEQWGIPKNINLFNNNLSFDDKYQLLFNNKGSYSGLHQELIRKSKLIVDKTPAYIRNLEFVRKNSNNIPILITFKNFYDNYKSYVIKRKIKINNFISKINLYIKIMNWIKNNKQNNIYIFLYNDIIKENFGEKLKKILPKTINLNNIDINYDNYLKKINTNEKYAYKDWIEDTMKYNMKIDKKLIETYDSLLNEIKYTF